MLRDSTSAMSPTPRRFAILHHTDYGREHWDLMLESDRSLLTWQLWHDPTSAEPWPRDAVKIGDHRMAYLDYEGPVSGNRGRVTATDRGELTMISQAATRMGFELAGQHLTGEFVLTQVSESLWRFSRG